MEREREYTHIYIYIYIYHVNPVPRNDTKLSFPDNLRQQLMSISPQWDKAILYNTTLYHTILDCNMLCHNINKSI